jgi:hypothetical protein
MNINHPKVSLAIFAVYLKDYSRNKWKQKPISDYFENRVMTLASSITEMIHVNFHAPTQNKQYHSFEQASRDCIRRIKISLRTGKKMNQSILKFYRHLADRLCAEAKELGTSKMGEHYFSFKEQLSLLSLQGYKE